MSFAKSMICACLLAVVYFTVSESYARRVTVCDANGCRQVEVGDGQMQSYSSVAGTGRRYLFPRRAARVAIRSYGSAGGYATQSYGSAGGYATQSYGSAGGYGGQPSYGSAGGYGGQGYGSAGGYGGNGYGSAGGYGNQYGSGDQDSMPRKNVYGEQPREQAPQPPVEPEDRPVDAQGASHKKVVAKECDNPLCKCVNCTCDPCLCGTKAK